MKPPDAPTQPVRSHLETWIQYFLNAALGDRAKAEKAAEAAERAQALGADSYAAASEGLAAIESERASPRGHALEWSRLTWLTTGKGVVVLLSLLLFASLIATAIYARWAWTWSADLNTKIAAVTMVLTGAALGIAALAGVIALAAYWRSLRKPRLKLEPTINGLGRPGGFNLYVRLWNESSYSGRNPAVRLEFSGHQGLSWSRQSAQKWGHVPGASAFQWEGGADLSIHGPHWFRDVPTFIVTECTVVAGGKLHLEITAVVDGDIARPWSRDISGNYVREIPSPGPPRALTGDLNDTP